MTSKVTSSCSLDIKMSFYFNILKIISAIIPIKMRIEKEILITLFIFRFLTIKLEVSSDCSFPFSILVSKSVTYFVIESLPLSV